MPSPLLQLRIPQDLADWLEAKHPSRGEVAAYVRQLLTAEQMKEAVAPLVPEGLVGPAHWSKGRLTDEDWKAFQEGAGFETPEETEILDRMHGITPDATVGEIADALEAEKAKPKARRKKVDAVVTQRGIQPSDIQIPVRCHCKRGMIIGAGPRKGQCTVCGNPKPLKESNDG